MTKTTQNSGPMKPLSLICAGLFLALAGPGPAAALELPAPAAKTFERSEEIATFVLPVGPYLEGQVESLPLSGILSQEVWRLSGGQTSAALMANLARQLTDAGYEVLFQCADAACGGFDFRFAIEVVAAPHMRVDLGDYQFFAARKSGEDGGNYAALLVSRSPGAGFVQITRIGPPSAQAEVKTVTSSMTGPSMVRASADAPIAEQLEQNGYAVLADLVFETGSSELSEGPYDSLAKLAAFLAIDPERRVALVGHTDATGSLEANIVLSKRRAASVRRRLVDRHAVVAAQMAAEGVGFLAPLTTNLSEQGRSQNRRVEVVLTSTR